MKNIYSIILIAVSMLMLANCEPQGFEPAGDGKITGIGVKEAVYNSSGTPSMQITLKDNEQLQLNVFIMPQDAKNKNLDYSNKYPELLEATATGLLTGKGIGTDTLTINALDGSGTRVSYVVNITAH